jgi:predicted lipase
MPPSLLQQAVLLANPPHTELIHESKSTNITWRAVIFDGSLLLLIPGTDDLVDIHMDMMFFMDHMWGDNALVMPYTDKPESGNWKTVRVHSGFLDAYLAVRTEMLEFIEQHVLPSDMQVRFVGHSLGAAVATLASLDAQYNFPEVANRLGATTFGSPRVGNGPFKDSYARRVPDTTRVVNGADVVCRHPYPIWGYQHIVNATHIGPPAWRSFFRGVNQHFLRSYVQSLW